MVKQMTIIDNTINVITWLRIGSSELFKVTLVAVVLLGAAEWYQEGLVSTYFNLNILLVIMVVSGILTVIFSKD